MESEVQQNRITSFTDNQKSPMRKRIRVYLVEGILWKRKKILTWKKKSFPGPQKCISQNIQFCVETRIWKARYSKTVSTQGFSLQPNSPFDNDC